MGWAIIAAVLAGAAMGVGFLLYVCSVPSSQAMGPALVRGPIEKARVVLTFDDGPSSPFTDQILDILREHKVPATFFLCGKNVDRFPDIVHRIHADRHTIGNHTYTHPLLYFQSRARMAEEIDLTQAAIERVTGHRPGLFRPPYGARWFGLFSVLRERGMRMVQWSDTGYDWKKGSAGIVRATLKRLRAGSIVLLHDGREVRLAGQVDASATVTALPAIIEGARRAGLDFVPIEEFLS